MKNKFLDYKSGLFRRVILIGKYAFKFPSCSSLYWFKAALHNNKSELKNWRGEDKRFKIPKDKLCPIRFALPFGLLNVMDRVEVLDDDIHGCDEVRNYIHHNFVQLYDDWMNIPCIEQKPQNYGILNNKVVIIDYSFFNEYQYKN